MYHLRKCDSHQGGVKGIKQECQLMVMGRSKRA